jgi:hypothetical protein
VERLLGERIELLVAGVAALVVDDTAPACEAGGDPLRVRRDDAAVASVAPTEVTADGLVG